MSYKCTFCEKEFTKESSMLRHLCVAKRRMMEKDERNVQYAYKAYVRFYKTQQGMEKTYDDFVNSKFYNGFVKFGTFIKNTKPLYPLKFIDYVIGSGINMNKWCDDGIYEKYLIELIQTESMETALERSILHMEKWAEATNNHWNEYFKKVSTHRAVNDIMNASISPWLLLNSNNGRKLLESFAYDQQLMVSKIIIPTVWVLKFGKFKSEVKLIKDIVKQSSI